VPDIGVSVYVTTLSGMSYVSVTRKLTPDSVVTYTDTPISGTNDWLISAVYCDSYCVSIW